jgi:ATP-dependent Clp protease ATP-binding subunit ClpA
VTPVEFPDDEVDADSYNGAKRKAISRIKKRLRRSTGLARSALATPTRAELDTAKLNISRGKREAAVELTIGLVVVEREATGGPLYVVIAPALDGFEVVLSERSEVAAAAPKALKRWLRDWNPDLEDLLAADERGRVELEPIEVPFPEEPKDDEDEDGEQDEEGGDRAIPDGALELTGQPDLGGIDRRDALVERVLAALASDGRSSVVLVGPHDVGKTALLNELAARLAAGDVPPGLHGRTLWRLSANELIAGARYTGMWQQRGRALVEYARATRAIFAMADPGAIVDAGRWSGSGNNLGRFLRPYMDSGELKLVCESTAEELAAARLIEPSFVEAFHRIDVPEPPDEDVREILKAASRRLSENQGVAIADDAAPAALELTRRFEPYRALPGKAVRLLEETVRLASSPHEPLGREEVTRAFAQRTGLPLPILSDAVPLRPDEVREFFEERVLGQDEAIGIAADLITVIKAGLNDPRKPLSTLFFVGPTGVGKTELTKALAEFLFGSADRVLRFDMGEFSSGDAVPRLIGTAWRRDENQGELTRRVREQPFCVVLLDEIEKAHHDVFDVLLSAIGEGRLTDAGGRTADFRNAIVVMTSNLGAGQRASGSFGFKDADQAPDPERHRGHFVERAEEFFRPEFFNRIDRVLAFRALDGDTIRRIARRELGRLLMREGVTRRQLLIEIDEDVVDSLAARGFDERYGARPLQREIERAVIRPLARVIVERNPRAGALIRFRLDGGEITAELTTVRSPEAPPATARGSGRSVDGSLVRSATAAAELAELVEAEQASAVVTSLRADVSVLVTLTHEPSFWDDPERARATLARLYELQATLGRLDTLQERADGLAEMGRQMRLHRDRRRVPELRQAIAEIEDLLTACRLELAAAISGPSADAIVVVTPVSAEAEDWAAALLAMYAAWAERTGRQAAPLRGRLGISVSASFELLAGEGGLHRRELPDRSVELARVTVVRRDDDGEGDAAGPDDSGVVVRIYADGRRRGVRDPRSGVRVGNVDAVLRAGEIDAFILAGLAAVRDAAPA